MVVSLKADVMGFMTQLILTMTKWFVWVEIFTFTSLSHALLGHPWVISVVLPGDMTSEKSDFPPKSRISLMYPRD